MPSKAGRTVSRRLRILLGSLFVLVCLWMIVELLESWHVEREIKRFARSPSQVRAESLAGLLQSHAASAKQRRRILTLLRRPTVTTRSAYPNGHPVVIALDQPFRLDFHNVLQRREMIWIVEGGGRHEDSGAGGYTPRTLCLPCEAGMGTHQFTIRCTSRLEIQHHTQLTAVMDYLRRLLGTVRLPLPQMWEPYRAYACEFEVPITVTVVPEAEAKTIEQTSPPELDHAMRDAFRVGPAGVSESYRTATGRIQFGGLKAIYYEDLPLSVAFRLTVQLSDEQGESISLEYSTPLVARADASGKKFLPAGNLPFTEPGTYQGTVTLRPDPNAAYDDPAIEAIWGGTLEFPISFTIREETNSP